MKALPPLPPNIGVDATGAVDLDRLPCTGCKHTNSKNVCKRFPPVFASATPIVDAKGQAVGLQPGGWCFPPAVEKCGEFARAEV